MFFKVKPVVVAGIVVVCMALAAGSFYAYFKFHATEVFRARVNAYTGHRVQMRHVKAEFPATFLMEGVSIDGILDCPRAKVRLDLLSLLTQDMRIHSIELDSPVIDLTKDELPFSSKNVGEQVAYHSSVSTVRRVMAGAFRVRDAMVKFKFGGHEYMVDRVEFRAKQFPLTMSPARTEFFLTASLAKINLPFVGSFLKTDGWFNFYARDMEAQGKIVDDVGRVGLQAHVFSKQNDMVVAGSVRLTSQQSPQASGKKLGLMEDMVLSLLSSTETDVDLGFSFQTKMDHVTIEKVNLSGEITTGLNSDTTSGNIVAGLKALGSEVLKISPASL